MRFNKPESDKHKWPAAQLSTIISEPSDEFAWKDPFLFLRTHYYDLLLLLSTEYDYLEETEKINKWRNEIELESNRLEQ